MTATAARPPTPAPATRQHPRNCFDALRLFAALCVVVQHAVAHLDTGFLWYREGSPWWFFDGVMMFFILSGSMVYASAERCRSAGRSLREYFRNRALRILPALYVYTAAMIVVVLALGVIPPPTATSQAFAAWVASNLLLVPVYHPAIFAHFGVGVVNGSLWTIPVEVGLYLLIPALLWVATKVGTRRMMWAVFLTGLASVALLGQLGGQETNVMVGKLLAVSPLPWLSYFAVGMLIGRAWPRLPQHWALSLASVGLYAAVSVGRGHVGVEWSGLLAVASAVPLAYATFWVGHHGPRFLSATTRRIGDLSFGAYIWHMPIVNVALWLGLRHHVPPAAVVPLVIAATLAVAFLSWRYVEKPALALKHYSSHTVRTS